MSRIRGLILTGLVTLGASVGGLLFAAMPALAAAPEAPDVTVQEPVHATTATLLGVINPNEAQEPNNKGGSYKFLYKAGATCTGGSVTKPSGLSLGGVHEELPAETVTGLTPDTDYTVCLSFTNLEGETKLSAEVPFTTAVAPEKPVTGSATVDTSTSEKLEGTLDPGSTMKVGGYFAYSNPGGSSCLEGVTAGLEEFEGEKEETIVVHTTIGGLEPHQKYTMCLVANDELGDTTPGNEVAFTTESAPPTIASETTAEVKSTTATLEAQINPQNESTKYTFEYSTEGEVGGALKGTIVKEHGAAELEGYPEQLGSVALTGLEAGKTYYYRVVAENAQSKGTPTVLPVQSFTTVPLPAIASASDGAPVTATTATFGGSLKPLNPIVSTQYHFAYNIGSSCAGGSITATVEAGTSAVPDTEVVAKPTEVRELQPNAEYTVCLVVSNAYGSVEGPSEEFSTLAAPPKVDSESVSNVTPSEATLEAQVNPNNRKVTYTFEYATEAAKIGTAGATTLPGAALEGFGDQTAAASTGPVLTVGATYYYRVVVKNEEVSEAIDGQVQSFTPQGEPLVGTGAAQDVTPTTANISGTVNPAGTETHYYFAYIYQGGYETALAQGLSDPYASGASTPTVIAGSDNTVHAVNGLLSGLAPGTTFHYVLVAENANGVTVLSPDRTFTTAAAEPEPAAPVTPTAAESTLGGRESNPALPATVPLIAYTPIAQLDATEAKEGKAVNPPSTKSLTNGEKLKKALKACKKDKKSSKRAMCERQAHQKYGAKSKKKGRK